MQWKLNSHLHVLIHSTWRESSPIATLNIYALIFCLRSLRNLYSLKLYASINICIILHVPPVKSSSTFPILHPTVLLRRKFIHACSGIKVTISHNSQKMGYPSIKCAGDLLRVCIIIRYSQYMYFQLLINCIIPLTKWVGIRPSKPTISHKQKLKIFNNPEGLKFLIHIFFSLVFSL